MRSGLLAKRLERLAAQDFCSSYGPEIYRVVLLAFSLAWQRFLESDPGPVAEFSEPELTTDLQALLDEIRREEPPPVKGFSPEVFESVARDASVVSRDGKHLEKRPDLTMRLLGNALDHAIFVECKIVGNRHSVTRYCGEGISRFVDEEYAWCMPTGLMVAYSRDGKSISLDLVLALSVASADGRAPYSTKQVPQPQQFDDDRLLGVFKSVHDRPNCGEIGLYHLWLSEDGSSAVS